MTSHSPDPDDHDSRPAKLGHRKSRNGCMKCKARRVKCDETRPVCGNCHRLKMDCSWPDRGRLGRPTPSPIPRLSPAAHSSTSGPATASPTQGSTPSLGTKWPRYADHGVLDLFPNLVDDPGGTTSLPESKARRLLEHRLMQNYLLDLTSPFPVSPAEDWKKLWNKVVPRMSLQHDNILYAIFTSSATHLLRTNPGDMDLFAARQSYLISALQEQRKEVANLTVDNADAVCFASLIILIASFAMLKERSLEPYEPPMEWLQLGRGAGTVIWRSVQAVEQADDETASRSHLLVVSSSYPRFGHDQSYFSPEMRQDFKGVLTQRLTSGDDDWDDDTEGGTRDAYEKALSYVGSIQRAIHNGEPTYAVARRIQVFALLVPPRFLDLVGMQRPRALVILAHFWATVAQVHGIWWLGDDTTPVSPNNRDAGTGISPVAGDSTAKREIRAIKGVLPEEWAGTMVWPLDMVGLRDIGE